MYFLPRQKASDIGCKPMCVFLAENASDTERSSVLMLIVKFANMMKNFLRNFSDLDVARQCKRLAVATASAPQVRCAALVGQTEVCNTSGIIEIPIRQQSAEENSVPASLALNYHQSL